MLFYIQDILLHILYNVLFTQGFSMKYLCFTLYNPKLWLYIIAFLHWLDIWSLHNVYDVVDLHIILILKMEMIFYT